MIAEGQFGEMLNEVFEQRVREPVLVGPLGIAEDTIQGLWISFLDLT